MASHVEDIMQATKDYWVSALGINADLVRIGHQDPRSDTTDQTSYPQIIFEIFDMMIDSTRRLGGIPYQRVNETTDTIDAKPLPIPINYHFQLDVLTDNKRQSWQFAEKIQSIIGARHDYIQLPSGEKLFMIHDLFVDLSSLLESSIYQTSLRYYVQSWIDSNLPSETLYKVKKLVLVANDQTMEVFNES